MVNAVLSPILPPLPYDVIVTILLKSVCEEVAKPRHLYSKSQNKEHTQSWIDFICGEGCAFTQHPAHVTLRFPPN